jgi:hypothetical protein
VALGQGAQTLGFGQVGGADRRPDVQEDRVVPPADGARQPLRHVADLERGAGGENGAGQVDDRRVRSTIVTVVARPSSCG